jgi:hypothetical protein
VASGAKKGRKVRFLGYKAEDDRARVFNEGDVLRVVARREGRFEVQRDADDMTGEILDEEHQYPAGDTEDPDEGQPQDIIDPDDIPVEEVGGPEGDVVEIDTSGKTLPEIRPTPHIQNIFKQHENPLNAAKALVRRSEETAYDLGGVLSYIHSNRLHLALGFVEGKRGFADYASQELGLEYRTAMYYIRIYDVFTLAGADEETVARLGWTKAKEIARVNVKDDKELLNSFLNSFPEMLEYAEEHSRPELIEYIREKFPKNVSENRRRNRPTRFTFKFDAARSESTKNLLDYVREKNADIPKDRDEDAFAVILREWAEMKGLKFEEAAKEEAAADEAATEEEETEEA